MTNKQAVLAFCAVMVNEPTAELELLNADLDPSANYSAADKEAIAKVSCSVLSSTLALSSVKEGDLTISCDREGIKSRLVFLSNQYGFTEFQDQGPTISAPKPW